MQFLKVAFIIFEVVLLFNLVILVHELGHFLAARWRGLKVERFAIWFGKPIWSRKIGGVEYALGCIPAGGYVALPQMATMETIEGKSDTPVEELPPVSALDKIIVAVAGPLFSFGLAVAFAAIVWVIGRPVSEKETTTTIGYVHKDSPAEKAGLRPGDRILEVDGYKAERFSGMSDHSITWRIVRSEGETVSIKVDRDGKVMEFNPVPMKEETKAWQRKALRQIGIEPAHTPMIGQVVANSPSAAAGLKPDDFVLEVNGIKLIHAAAFASVIRTNGLAPITLKVQRDKQDLAVTVKPEIPISGEKVPRIGIVWDDTGRMRLVYPGPTEQVKAALNSMTSTFGALFSPKSDIKPHHLSGPVGIMRIYYLLFESDYGWRMAIWFSVVLNINLGLLNLLPIPVLDGGHITLALIEAIMRRPLNVRLLNWVQTGCAMLVIGYILYVSFYDVQDLKREKIPTTNTEMKFAPKPAEISPAPLPAK
jgi:regulator of sigma E protease